MNAFLCVQDKIVCEFSAYVAFNTAIDGQTDVKHEQDFKTKLDVTVEDRVEMLPPSQRVSLERESMPKLRTLFCLVLVVVHIIKRSFLTLF